MNIPAISTSCPDRLATDLTKQFGRGFGRRNVFQMRAFYLAYREILQTASALSEAGGRPEIVQTLSAQFGGTTAHAVAVRLRLPWSHYARLLELGGDFTFVGRQRRLRVGDEWYRIDLLFFHRRLRCLVIIDLKLGKFTHADAGQMHLYVNYAREHWMLPHENPPVGLILCAEKDHAVAKYALEGLPNKVLATEYRTTLPKERLLVEAIETTKRQLEKRTQTKPNKPKSSRKARGRKRTV